MATLELSEEEWKTLMGIARFLNYFVREKRYSYVDRRSSPYACEILVYTLQEALGEARAAPEEKPRPRIPASETVKDFFAICTENLIYSTTASAPALSAYIGAEPEVAEEGEGYYHRVLTYALAALTATLLGVAAVPIPLICMKVGWWD